MRELLSYLPDAYQNSPETVAFQTALQPEVDGVWAARDSLLAQLDPYTADWGLDYWEAALGIAPAGHLSLETRRRQIAAKLQGRGPTTADTLRQLAETFLGVPVEVTEVFGQYRVELTAEGLAVDREGMARLREQLIAVLPAHLDFQVVLPRWLLLAVTPTVGPRQGETMPNRFRGRLPAIRLAVTAWGGAASGVTPLPPATRGGLGAAAAVGPRPGPRLSHTVPDSRLPASALPVGARLGGRMTAAELPRGAALI